MGSNLRLFRVRPAGALLGISVRPLAFEWLLRLDTMLLTLRWDEGYDPHTYRNMVADNILLLQA